MPGNVTLLDPQGVAHDVPAEQAGDMVARGWRAQTQADVLSQAGAAASQVDYGGVHGAIGAVGAGLARGATLGGSDLAARLIGGDEATDTLRGLRAENPTLSTGADIAGTLLPAVLTGGAALPAGIAGDVGRGVAAAAGGGFRGVALGGAAEGALYGLGGGVSELSLSQDPLTVEHAASTLSSGMLYGAGFGAAGGVALHGLAEGLGAAKSAVDDALISRSADRAMKAVGELDTAAAAEPASITPETDVTTLDRAGLKAAREHELEAIDAAREPDRRAFVDDFRAANDATQDARPWKYSKGSDSAYIRGMGKEALEADIKIRSLLKNETGLAEHPERALDALQRQQQAYQRLIESAGREMREFNADFAAGPETIRAEILAGKVQGYVPDALSVRGVDQAVENEMVRRFGSTTSPVLPARLKSAVDINATLERNQALQNQLARLAASPASPRLEQIEAAEQALGGRTAAPAEAPHDSPIGALLKVAGHAAGPLGTVASTAMGAFGGLRKAAGAAAERAGRAASSFLDVAGKSTAAAAPYAPVLATKVLAQLRYGDGNTEDDNAKRAPAATLPALYKARTDEVKRQVHIAADGTFQMRPEARQKMAAKLSGLGAVDPRTADQLESAGAARIAWLAGQIPRRPDIAGMQTGPDTWHPSDLEMRTWARKAAAADDPQGVLERVVHGQVTPEDAQVMRALYPEMMQAFVQTVSVQLPTLRKSLPYQKKLSLSLFSGVPVDPALDPKILSFLQGQFTDEPGTSGGTAAPKPSPQFGSIKKSPDMATPAQARAQGAHV